MQSEEDYKNKEILLTRKILAEFRKMACIHEYALKKQQQQQGLKKMIDCYFEALEERWLNRCIEIDQSNRFVIRLKAEIDYWKAYASAKGAEAKLKEAEKEYELKNKK